MGAGAGIVASVFSSFMDGPIVGIVASIITAQLYLWEVPSYDNGNGVELIMEGIIPSLILYIYSQ